MAAADHMRRPGEAAIDAAATRGWRTGRKTAHGVKISQVDAMQDAGWTWLRSGRPRCAGDQDAADRWLFPRRPDYLAEIAQKQGIRLASRAIQEAPDYLKGLLSGRDQLKKARLTHYLDTSAVSRQVDQLQGIATSVAVGVLAGAVMIASAIELAFQQHAPHILVKTAQVAFAAARTVAVVLVIVHLSAASGSPQ